MVNGLYWAGFTLTPIFHLRTDTRDAYHPLPMSAFTVSGTMSSKWGGSTAWIASLAEATVATAATAAATVATTAATTAAVAATMVSPIVDILPIVDTAEILAGRGVMGGAHLGGARVVGYY